MKKISVIIPLGENSDFDALDYLEKQKNKIDFIIERGPNPSRNRNNASRKAKTDFVAFINGHTLLSDNWADEVQEFFSKHPKIDIVGGPQLTPENDNWFGKISGYALSSIFGAADVSARYIPRKLVLNADEKQITSANLICRKRVLKKIKFDENIYPGEDPKFISDAKREGFKVAYSPSIIVYNKRRQNVGDFAKQIFNYGQMRPKKERITETLKKPFFLVPSIFVLYLSVFNILFLIHWFFVIPILVYFILSLLFSLFESIKNKHPSSFFRLPFLFFVIHLSYGVGFLKGLVFAETTKKIFDPLEKIKTPDES